MTRIDKKRFRVSLMVLFLCLSLTGLTFAADSTVRVGAGMLTTSTQNPAMIGIKEPTLRLTLLPIDVSLSNNSWDFSQIDKYIDAELTESAKDELLDDLDDSGFRLDLASLSTVDLGVSVISANFSLRTLSTGTIAKDLFEVAFKGNELNRDYNLDSLLGAAAYGDASVGLSFGLGESLRVGGRYHRLLGVAYADANVTGGGRISSGGTSIGFEGDLGADYMYSFGEGVRGEGSAYDVGVSLQLSKALAVGFAILDVGHIEWHDLTMERYEGSLDTTSDEGARFDLTGQETIQHMVWQLPRRYEASLGLQLSRSLHLGATYTHMVHKTSEGFQIEPTNKLQSMVTWNGLKFLPIGVGTAYSEADGLSFSAEAGLRLGPLQTRARLSDVQTLFGDGGSKSIGFAVDMGLVF